MQGSRSAGLAAATWASLVSMGERGYLEAARAIMRAGVAYARERRGQQARSGAMYGIAGSPEGQTMLEDALRAWIDATYEP